jgi:hypothetical protein
MSETIFAIPPSPPIASAVPRSAAQRVESEKQRIAEKLAFAQKRMRELDDLLKNLAQTLPQNAN